MIHHATPTQKNPMDIVIWHIGGEGDYGPIGDIIKRFGQNVILVLFEARDSAPEFLNERDPAELPVKIVINRCIAERTGPCDFFINKGGLSSSALPPATSALDEHVTYAHCHTWKENTQLEKIVELDAVSIDDLIAEGQVPSPDVLSMDVQGAEFSILKGARKTIQKSVLAVVSEVEFSALYEGQGLFHDQMRLLAEMNFRLADILNVQYFHPGPAIGSGFLTVGEAVFLRGMGAIAEDASSPNSFVRLMKLAAISFGLGRYSYSNQIYRFLIGRYPRQLTELDDHVFKRELSRLHQYVQANLSHYWRDNEFFVRGGAPDGYVRPGHGNVDWRTAVKTPLELWDPLTFGTGGSAELSRHSEILAGKSGREETCLRWHQTQPGTDNPIFCYCLPKLSSFLGQKLTFSFLARSESELDLEVCFKANFGENSPPPFTILRARVGDMWREFEANSTVQPLPADCGSPPGSVSSGTLEVRVMLPPGWTGTMDFARPTLKLPRAAVTGLP
jgi:FkbM family methyltransferase